MMKWIDIIAYGESDVVVKDSDVMRGTVVVTVDLPVIWY